MSSWVTWAIQAAIMLGIGALAWFLKQFYSQAQKDTRENTRRIEKLEDEFKRMPFVYTTRDDFIRSMSNLESNIDKVGEKVDRVLERISQLGGSK